MALAILAPGHAAIPWLQTALRARTRPMRVGELTRVKLVCVPGAIPRSEERRVGKDTRMALAIQAPGKAEMPWQQKGLRGLTRPMRVGELNRVKFVCVP